ncbi:ATP-dependent nuclease [Xanthobacter pseudotagetidis]|uniref:ATP-dependent nuclease n=1 Tax=Xanthobacter pseudotagetidis TaxID=3119911 RepID=UPI00372A773E
MFRSQVRQSVINALIDRAATRNYGKYLPKLTLKRVRGFENQPISFDFPVTAIIGPNGGGKTTVLGAAACAYKEVSPRRFFAKSGAYDESMQDWSIEYELIDRNLAQRDTVRRTTSFRNRRWNREAPDRRVLIFGVSRTVPANERTELAKCATTSFAVPEDRVTAFSDRVREAVGRILGKDVAGYRTMKVRRDGRIQLLTGRTKGGTGYSEFHFGAGESSIIRMIAEIEAGEDQSLILIEEIENGLHPVATIRLVEYLIEVADRKKVQVVFTTHSNEALLPLPSKAIWVATEDRLFQGKLDVGSLRAITGQITREVVVFVEDALAKTWVETAIRQRQPAFIDHVEVHAMEGDGAAVKTHRYHNANPVTDVPSICYIDGDSRQEVDGPSGIYRLPGAMPETYILDSVLSAWDRFGGKLSVALLKEFEQAPDVKRVCEEISHTNMDPHLLFSQIGERLSLLPEETVRMAFCTIWAQAYPEEADAIVSRIVALRRAETA